MRGEGQLQGSKVFWSDLERKLIITTAIDIQRERPELSGLSLLRQAIRKLPPDRHRKLISLSQVPWFEPELKKAARRRNDDTSNVSDASHALTLIDQLRQSQEALIERLGALASEQEKVFSALEATLTRQHEIIELLVRLVGVVKKKD